MKTSQFALKHNISPNKVKLMCPYIKGAYQCEYCHKWHIPDDAKPFYIPDKNKYTKLGRIYCQVLDAIALNMILDERFTGMNPNKVKTVVKELAKNKLIVKNEGAEETSLEYTDYTVSYKAFEWESKETLEKNKIILEALKTIQSVSNGIVAIANKEK